MTIRHICLHCMIRQDNRAYFKRMKHGRRKHDKTLNFCLESLDLQSSNCHEFPLGDVIVVRIRLTLCLNLNASVLFRFVVSVCLSFHFFLYVYLFLFISDPIPYYYLYLILFFSRRKKNIVHL